MQKKIFISAILQLLCFCFTNGQGVWTQKASLPGAARMDAFSFAIGANAYIGAGGDANANQKLDVWEYDGTNNTWTQKQNFIGGARWQGVSFSIGTKGYFGTGQDALSAYNNDFWEYDPTNDTWTQKANVSQYGRCRAIGFSIGNKGYVGTGDGGNPTMPTEQNDFLEYDPLLNSWTPMTNVPGAAREFALGFSIGTKGYVGMGFNSSSGDITDFWEYDPSQNAWTQKSNYPGSARVDIDGGHFTMGNYGYVGTGVTNGVYQNDFWRYDPSGDTWTQFASLPASARMGTSSFTLNNIGYLAFGYSASPAVVFNDLWSFSLNETVAGINETNNKFSISIYPNPFSSQTTLNIKENLKNTTLAIYNSSGQLIKQMKNIAGQTIQLQRDNLPAGIYFVRLLQDDKIISSEKLIIAD